MRTVAADDKDTSSSSSNGADSMPSNIAPSDTPLRKLKIMLHLYVDFTDIIDSFTTCKNQEKTVLSS